MEGSQPSIPRPNTAPQLIFTSEGVESASPLVHQLVQPSSPHKPATAVAKVRPGAGSKRSPSKPQADRPKQPSAAGDSARGAAAKASDETRDSTKPTTPARPGREGKTPRSTKVEQLGTANRDAFGKGIFASRVPTPPGGATPGRRGRHLPVALAHDHAAQQVGRGDVRDGLAQRPARSGWAWDLTRRCEDGVDTSYQYHAAPAYK